MKTRSQAGTITTTKKCPRSSWRERTTPRSSETATWSAQWKWWCMSIRRSWLRRSRVRRKICRAVGHRSRDRVGWCRCDPRLWSKAFRTTPLDSTSRQQNKTLFQRQPSRLWIRSRSTARRRARVTTRLYPTQKPAQKVALMAKITTIIITTTTTAKFRKRDWFNVWCRRGRSWKNAD